MELVDYEEYVVDNGFAEPGKVEFYSVWVRRFLRLRLSERLSNVDKIRQFRESLDVDENLNEWRRNQGQQAIEIYLNMYLESVEGGKIKGDNPTVAKIIDETRTALRLRKNSKKIGKNRDRPVMRLQ